MTIFLETIGYAVLAAAFIGAATALGIVIKDVYALLREGIQLIRGGGNHDGKQK